MTVKAYGAHAGDKPLEPMEITRRAPGMHDVRIDGFAIGSASLADGQ